MTRQVLIRSPPVNRRQPLFLSEDPKWTPKTMGRTTEKKGKKFGEMAGGTAAECAAVCCCCPCAVMNLLVLAVYKVPKGLCKKAWRHQKRKHIVQKRQALLTGGPSGSREGGEWPAREDLEAEVKDVAEKGKSGNGDGASEAANMEEEMWARFNGTGFWRSPSQRDTC